MLFINMVNWTVNKKIIFMQFRNLSNILFNIRNDIIQFFYTHWIKNYIVDIVEKYSLICLDRFNLYFICVFTLCNKKYNKYC